MHIYIALVCTVFFERWFSLTRGSPDLANSYGSSPARPLLRFAQHYHNAYMPAYGCEYQSQTCAMFCVSGRDRRQILRSAFSAQTNMSFQIQQYFSNMLSASQWLEEGLLEKLKKREENMAMFERLLQDAKREQKSEEQRGPRKYCYKKVKALLYIDVSVSK